MKKTRTEEQKAEERTVRVKCLLFKREGHVKEESPNGIKRSDLPLAVRGL